MNHLTRACYVDCSKENYCDDTFALIILREGCFISYLLDTVVDQKWDELSKLALIIVEDYWDFIL